MISFQVIIITYLKLINHFHDMGSTNFLTECQVNLFPIKLY